MLEFLFFLNTLLPECICTPTGFWRSADTSASNSLCTATDRLQEASQLQVFGEILLQKVLSGKCR